MIVQMSERKIYSIFLQIVQPDDEEEYERRPQRDGFVKYLNGATERQRNCAFRFCRTLIVQKS